MPQQRDNTIFIFNCYPEKSRKNFDLSNVGHPQDFIIEFLSRHFSEADLKVRFIADLDKALPSDKELSSCRGCIWTGSDLTIYETNPMVERQIQLAENLFRLGISSIGSCWGIQMAAVAAGGRVAKNPRGREWGIARDILITDAGKRSRLLKGKPDKFDAFIMHLDEVASLPVNTEILAGNDHTRVQALEVYSGRGSFFGTQYHPEYNLFEMGRLISARSQALVNEGFFPTVEAVFAHAGKLIDLHKNPDSISLRQELNIGDDIIDPAIKEQELGNWLEFIR